MGRQPPRGATRVPWTGLLGGMAVGGAVWMSGLGPLVLPYALAATNLATANAPPEHSRNHSEFDPPYPGVLAKHATPTAVIASRHLLQHFLAAIAYRTQKALRDAPVDFADFRAGTHVRTPHELLWHMTGVIGYARTMLHGGDCTPPRLETLAAEVARFHATLAALRDDFGNPALTARISDEQFLHGPLADTMTHAGHLALLRRLAGAPVPSENFIFAEIVATNVGEAQPAPAAPDAWWRPDQPPLPPAPDPLQAARDAT